MHHWTGGIMEKITRAELARRRRINLYKKIIICAFCVMTITPLLISIFLLYKVNRLEKKLDYVLSQGGGDYLTYRSSHDALLGSSDLERYLLEPSVRSVLGNTELDTKLAENELSAGSANAGEDVNNAALGAADDAESTGSAEGMADADNAASSESAGNIANTDSIAYTDNATGAGASSDEAVETVSGKTKKKQAKRVYLTFDDGPSVYTGQILDILEANDVKATFFVIGKDKTYYDYYKRIVDEGHALGMHSYTHEYQKVYASTESFGEEIEELQTLLKDVTGVESHIFRFPGGSSNNVSPLPIEDYIAYLNEHNINYYDWNALSGDAVNASLSPEQLVNNIMKDVRENKDSVVLMHDLATAHATVESLQMLIDTLKSEGYEILPIDENTPLIQHVSCNSVDE